MRVLIVNNEYGDTSKVFYDWENKSEFYLDTIMEEVKQNLVAGYPINLEFREMTEEEFNKLPEL